MTIKYQGYSSGNISQQWCWKSTRYTGNYNFIDFDQFMGDYADLYNVNNSYYSSGSYYVVVDLTYLGSWKSGYYYSTYSPSSLMVAEVYLSSSQVSQLNNGTDLTVTATLTTMSY